MAATSTKVTDSTVTPETVTFDVSGLSVTNGDEVRAAYENGDKSAKAAIRAFVTKVQKDAMRASDAETAFAAFALIESLRTVSVKSDKVVDYVTIVAERIIALESALFALTSGYVPNLPEGVEVSDSDIATKLDELRESGDRSEWLASGIPFATVKWGNGLRRDITAHVAEWCESVENGTFGTIASIAAFRSNEYGTDNPSNGAIAAHLFPMKDGVTVSYGKSDLTGVIPVEASATTARGARKI